MGFDEVITKRKLKQTNISIPASLRDEFRRVCASQDVPMRVIARRLVTLFNAGLLDKLIAQQRQLEYQSAIEMKQHKLQRYPTEVKEKKVVLALRLPQDVKQEFKLRCSDLSISKMMRRLIILYLSDPDSAISTLINSQRKIELQKLFSPEVDYNKESKRDFTQ